MNIKRIFASVASVVLLSTTIIGLNPATTSAATSPCPYTKHKRVICVNKIHQKLVLFEYGKQVMMIDARFGKPSTPTREGTFKVYWKSKNHVSSLYGSAMPYSMFFSGGQAIHYSEDFAINGYYGASHGCVNVRDYKAVANLYNRTPVGTPVVVYKGIR